LYNFIETKNRFFKPSKEKTMNDFESLDYFGDDDHKGHKKNRNKEELEKDTEAGRRSQEKF
jgi:hypothetical protein